jgi:hypothetical protein
MRDRNLTEGDRIIWDSGFGYEIGYFIEDSDHVMYHSYRVNLISGLIIGKSLRNKDEVYKYTDVQVEKLYEKYGYIKEFTQNLKRNKWEK